MHPSLEQLLIVQEIDCEVMRLRSELEHYPHLRQAQLDEVAGAKIKLDEAENKARDMEKTIRSLDLDTKKFQADLKNFQAQQFQVKTQKEYDALTHEIEQSEKGIADAEEEELRLLESEEKVLMEVKELEARLHERQEKCDEEIARLAGREKEKTDQVNAYLERRREQAHAIDDGLLHRYGRLSEHFPGNVVVPVKDGNCGGCFMRILPHRMQELQRTDSINECDSCHRFLFVEPE